MKINIESSPERTTVSIVDAPGVWGIYEAKTPRLKIWTPGRAMTRLVDANDGQPEGILGWMEIHASGPVGRAATTIAAASLWADHDDLPEDEALAEYEAQVVLYYPDEDMSRWALEQITKAHLARGHA